MSSVWRRNIIVRVMALDSVLPQIAAELLGAAKLNFCGDRILVQEPHADGEPLFARAETALPIGGGRGCSIWAVLDRTEEGGSLAFAPGSHRWADRAAIRPTPSGNVDGEKPLRFAAEPGDLVVQNLRTYCAAGGNSSGCRRRLLALHYCAEDMRFRRPAGVPARASHPALKDGGVLDSLDFPVVWPRPYPGFAIATLYDNAALAPEQPRRGRK